ncbi:MAG: FKBP-type peptidyl-prolyl cis-trans isomerase [Bacteroidales bacterium]|nr:FKBP-type peptidyl-prolyl cis-trans isomerase [Bacteroidales bacterium]
MRIKDLLLATLIPAYLLTAACAVEPQTETYASQDRVMKAWMRHNYPGKTTYGDTGLYVLDMEPGDGPAIGDSAYVFAHYVKSKLDGEIISTNDEGLARQLGTYSVLNHYGSSIWRIDQGYLPDDLETVLRAMKAGGYAKVALPLSASGHALSMYSAFSGTEESYNEILELTIDTVVNRIYAYQEQVMKDWFQRNYQVSDTAAEHLYFKKLVEKTAESDTISEGHNVSVRYIGRLLNGQVFDTNIEDTAKFYRIWKSTGSYNALTISYYKDDPEQFGNNNSVVDGFGKAIRMMNFGEKAVTVFNSELGYGEKGKSPSVPEYAPLCFWLYIEPKD